MTNTLRSLFTKKQLLIMTGSMTALVVLHVLICWFYNDLPVVISGINNDAILPLTFFFAMLSSRLPRLHTASKITFAISFGVMLASMIQRWLEAYILM